MEKTKAQLDLAVELLDDIELSRLSVQGTIMKASRLARLLGDEDAMTWLRWEQSRIPGSDAGRLHMDRTNRWTDKEEGKGYWIGAAQLDEYRTVNQRSLDSLRLPDVGGDYASVALREARTHISTVSSSISKLGAVLTLVNALVYEFVLEAYHQLSFSARQADLFEAVRLDVDSRLAPLSGDILAKVNKIYERLAEGDPESVSQAMNTCRRMIDSLADALFPAQQQPVQRPGGELQVTQDKVKNRLNAYVLQRCDSESRQKRLGTMLDRLYERTSAGVHADVDLSEARFIFALTYLYLGEVVALG